MARASSKPIPALLQGTAAVLLLMLSTVASAESGNSGKIMEDCSFPTATTGSLEQGLRAWIDPETGELREPTDAERQVLAKRYSLESLLNRSHDGLEVEVRPDGTKVVHLKGRFMHTLVATLDEDGTIKTECIVDEEHLTRAKPEPMPER